MHQRTTRTRAPVEGGTHDDHVKGHVVESLQPLFVRDDADGSHFFGWDAVVADDLVVPIDHALADIDADDQLGVLGRQRAGDETCGCGSSAEHHPVSDGGRTCSTRVIHDGRHALLEQPGVPHGASDKLGVFLCILVVVVRVCCCVKVVLVRRFVVGAVRLWWSV